MNWLKEKKSRVAVALLCALAVVMSALPVFASESPSGTANADVRDAMSTVAADMVATGNAIIPIALTVVGISLVVVFGIKMFKRIVNK